MNSELNSPHMNSLQLYKKAQVLKGLVVSGILCILFLPSSSVHAMNESDIHCYLEKTTFPASTGDFTVVNTFEGDNIVFFQDGKILSTGSKTIFKNAPKIPIQLRTGETGFVGNEQFLFDDNSATYAEISSDILAAREVVLTFDSPNILKRESFRVNLDVSNNPNYIFSISEDGTNFVNTSPFLASNFDVKSLRITFPRSKFLSAPVKISTFLVSEAPKNILVLDSVVGTNIEGYRKYACKGGASANEIPAISQEKINTIDPSAAILLKFEPNSMYVQDTDGDGISNELDNCVFLSNSDQKDRNFDGLGDVCSDDDKDGRLGDADNCPTIPNGDQKDINANKIGDACEFDTDSDGVPDGVDNALQISNPDQSDMDKDGIGDVLDNCKIFNPEQEDFNKNSIGDVCENAEDVIKNNDKDKDGIVDSLDNCPKIQNPSQEDGDQDGIGNGCDNCSLIKNPDQGDLNKNNIGDMCEDIDTDGILGWRDNCPAIKNPDQKDSNNDSIGDVCTDSDKDEVFDVNDNCPDRANSDQSDIDTDGVGNVCDLKDDRAIESNRIVFVALVSLIALFFMSGIGFIFWKVSQKKSKQ